jgi:hypothetical protein
MGTEHSGFSDKIPRGAGAFPPAGFRGSAGIRAIDASGRKKRYKNGWNLQSHGGLILYYIRNYKIRNYKRSS